MIATVAVISMREIVCHNWGPKSIFFIVAKRGDAGTGEYTV